MKKRNFGFFLVEASMVRKMSSLKSVEVITGGRCLIECIAEVISEGVWFFERLSSVAGSGRLPCYIYVSIGSCWHGRC